MICRQVGKVLTCLFYLTVIYYTLGGDNISKGKQFEKLFREQVEALGDVYCYRILDYSNFMGISNPCDTLAYCYPYMFMIEMKTTETPSLPFKNISNYQLKSLLAGNKIYGVKAGFLIWWVNHDTTKWVPPEVIVEHEKKSLRYDYKDNRILTIHGKKKRVFFEYDWKRFFREVCMK